MLTFPRWLSSTPGPARSPLIPSKRGSRSRWFRPSRTPSRIGALRFDWTRNGAIIKTLVGHGHLAYLPAYLRISNAALAHTGRFIYFTDYWEATTYDSQLRVEFTDWLAKHQTKDDGCHTLVRSKLISMGVAVMNATLGGGQTHYKSRTEFERVVAKHGLPARRPMPAIAE